MCSASTPDRSSRSSRRPRSPGRCRRVVGGARPVRPGRGRRARARRGDRAAGCSDLAHVNSFTEFFADLGLGHAVLLRRLRDRHRAHPRAAAAARGDRAGRCRSRSPTRSAASLAAARRGRVARLRRLGAGDDRDRHADPGPLGHRRAAHGLRPLPAGGRGGRRVRADPAADAGPLDAERAAQRADPDRVRRAGGAASRCSPVRSAGRTIPMLERTIETSSQLGGALDRRARVRARAARLRARARPAARRVRRRPDHPAGAAGARDPAVRLQAHRRRVRRSSSRSSSS